ncbi:MAG: hypothetical protein AAFR11_03145 [Pseudomonadota bacterium]
MLTVLEVAEIAKDSYKQGTGAFARRNFTRNTSSGFQGAIYERGGFVIIAFKGTSNPHDLVSDAQLAVGRHPEQLDDAAELFAAGLGGRGDNKILVTGHSLGGALAQAVGYITNAPFVTFNAPPMATNMANPSWFPAFRSSLSGSAAGYGGAILGGAVFAVVSKLQQMKLGTVKNQLGLNIRLPYDPVSAKFWGGGHVGNVIEIKAPGWCFNRHSMANVVASLRGPSAFVGAITIDT